MNLDLSGLDALATGGLFTGAAPGKALDLALAAIDFDPEQPRGRIDEARLAELADSIRQHGVLQAISVRPHPSSTGPLRGELRRTAGTREPPRAAAYHTGGDRT